MKNIIIKYDLNRKSLEQIKDRNNLKKNESLTVVHYYEYLGFMKEKDYSTKIELYNKKVEFSKELDFLIRILLLKKNKKCLTNNKI